MQVSLESLYDNNKERALGLFLVFTNDFLEQLHPDNRPLLNMDNAYSFVRNLVKDLDFPANGGFDKASPFKKAANIFVWLQAESPIEDSRINAALGYALVKKCLHKATFFNKETESDVILEEPIKLSEHFYTDLLEASRSIVPQDHFKTYSLLFESLAYESNPEASYTKII